MRCSNCTRTFAANWRSGSPGGFSAPGSFVPINVGLLAGTVVASLTESWLAAFFVGTAAVVGLIAQLSAWSDATSERIGVGRARGLSCPHCGAKSPVWPWSY